MLRSCPIICLWNENAAFRSLPCRKHFDHQLLPIATHTWLHVAEKKTHYNSTISMLFSKLCNNLPAVQKWLALLHTRPFLSLSSKVSPELIKGKGLTTKDWRMANEGHDEQKSSSSRIVFYDHNYYDQSSERFQNQHWGSFVINEEESLNLPCTQHKQIYCSFSFCSSRAVRLAMCLSGHPQQCMYQTEIHHTRDNRASNPIKSIKMLARHDTTHLY